MFILFDKVHNLCPNTSFFSGVYFTNPNAQSTGTKSRRKVKKVPLKFVETCQIDVYNQQSLEKLQTSDFPLADWIFHHSNSFRNFKVFSIRIN
jgi:hypothetical protein